MSVFSTLIAASCLSAPVNTPTLTPLGEATYKKAMFKLYDASLCTMSLKKEEAFDMEEPFVLALDYRRKFSSEQITKAGIHEMARFARKEKEAFADIKPIFLECFPDVVKGDTIIAISESETKAKFYYNGEMSCEVDYPEFRNLFFGIWLGTETRVPKQAAQLKGENAVVLEAAKEVKKDQAP